MGKYATTGRHMLLLTALLKAGHHVTKSTMLERVGPIRMTSLQSVIHIFIV